MGVPLEEDLKRRGLTLGHFPSSILCTTVGGWLAARSAGQCSGRTARSRTWSSRSSASTGTGEVVTLRHRTSGPDLIPLVIGSEGTLAIVTSATLRLHPEPAARAFAAFSFPTTEPGWEAMRAMFQAGLRPAVARLYDPFDAMLARRGSVKKDGADSAGRPGSAPPRCAAPAAPRRAQRAARGLVRQQVLGGALVVLIFEGEGEAPQRDLEQARALLDDAGARSTRARARREVAPPPLRGELPPGAGVRGRALLRHDGGRRAVVEAARALRRRAARARRARLRDGAPVPRVPRWLLHLLLFRRHAPGDGVAGGAAGTSAARHLRSRVERGARPRRSRRAGRSRTTTASAAQGAAHGAELGAGGVERCGRSCARSTRRAS